MEGGGGGDAFAAVEAMARPGVLRITTHAGNFCLAGNPAEGYAPAPAEMPADRCDLVGNPYDEALRPAQRQSLAFASLLAEARTRLGDRVEVVVEDAGRDEPAVAYPQGAGLAASAWNAAAEANNRVEVAFEPTETATP